MTTTPYSASSNTTTSLKERLKTKGSISHQRDARWELIIRTLEVTELMREQRHLMKKSRERELSTWEQLRLEQVGSEITVIMQRTSHGH